MLIYNSKKEFIGIDEIDLHQLGFSTLTELRAQSADFADMFVKTPGYVHNFKHVSWIDFVECADTAQSSKVIIHANSKNFKCTLDVKSAYLVDDPAKSYLIFLSNIIELSDTENKDISQDLQEKPAPQTVIKPVEEVETVEDIELVEEIVPQIEEIESIDEPEILDLPLDLDFDDEIAEVEPIIEIEDVNTLDEDDFKIDVEELSEKTPTQKLSQIEEVFDNGYVYNPQIASDELGLPVDLIEEFIEDFIAQAKEFEEELYSSLEEDNNDNVKILSHKLKGVAANLRVEDAFEALVVVNTSQKNDEIKTNLDEFYKIISKLAGEKILVEKQVDNFEQEDNEIEINFKDDELDIFEESQEQVEESEKIEITIEEDLLKPIEDSEVPQKIEIPELADDEFLNIAQETEEVEIDYDIDIETITDEETLSLQEESIEIDDIELLEDTLQEEEILEEEIVENEESKIQPIEINYDKELVANEIGLDQESFLELFNDYTQEAKELSESISNAIDENDITKWQKSALQLKGMSDNMRVNEFTQELETLMQTQDSNIAKDANYKMIAIITEFSK